MTTAAVQGKRFGSSWRIQARYCARELSDGTRCSHHIEVHDGEGACQGLGPYGERCICGHFKPREET